MNIYGSFPGVRMRRMRRDDFSRRLMRETLLDPGDLSYPVFILDGKNRTQQVASMPGVERMTVAWPRLLGLGATAAGAPQDVGDGIQVATVKDPFGNLLGIIENPHFKLEGPGPVPA